LFALSRAALLSAFNLPSLALGEFGLSFENTFSSAASLSFKLFTNAH